MKTIYSILLVILVSIITNALFDLATDDLVYKQPETAVLNYSKASRLDSDAIFVINTNTDINGLYAVGDTVWVDATGEMPRLCDECTFSFNLDQSNTDYFKAVIR